MTNRKSVRGLAKFHIADNLSDFTPDGIITIIARGNVFDIYEGVVSTPNEILYIGEAKNYSE
jgi:hypothetical protein